MTDQPPQERLAYESAKLWMEQRNKKPVATASFAPHTPPTQRSISTFSSPGSILGREEDVVVIELTSRYLHAGIEGETGPQCRILFGPESNRRVGDHRNWMPGYRRRREAPAKWGRDYELWRNKVGDVDLGLLSDMLERNVRDAYNNHLLVDAGMGRLVLVLPSLVPHPVLESVLSTLFQRWKYPNITLLPSPTMAIVAAGLRSGLVVDIGWEETVITSIYEYREVASHQSTRALKMFSQNLASSLRQRAGSQSEGHTFRFDLDFIDEIITRATPVIDASTNHNDDSYEAVHLETSADGSGVPRAGELNIEVDWPCGPSSCPVKVPKHEFVKILLETYLGGGADVHFDDHEVTLPQLIFKALLSLSPDLRGTCMSRIIFTGRGSESSMLRHQVMKHVLSLVQTNGWTTVRGRKLGSRRLGLSDIAQGSAEPADAKHNATTPAGKDYIEEKIQKQKVKSAHPHVQGNLREVRSLGAWTGASLLTSLKIRGFVEVERERFLSHGLSGANRDSEISVQPQQRMSSFGLPTSSKHGDRTSWTLGGWG